MITNCMTDDSTLMTGWDLRGLSTDGKPTDDQVPNGSTFLEMDTKDVYIFDKQNTQWRKL